MCKERAQHVVEIYATDVERDASGEDEESTNEDPTESQTQTRTSLTTWKPPHVEKQSVLQLHLEMTIVEDVSSEFARPFVAQWNRSRQHQQVRDVTLRPLMVFANLGRKDWNNWNHVPLHISKRHRENSSELATPIRTTNGKTLAKRRKH